MSTVTLPVSTFETVPMPPVCARTGRPADRTVRVSAYRTPPIAWLGLIVFGWFVFWLLTRNGPRVDLDLPASGWVTRRRVLGWALFVVGVAGMVTSPMAAGGDFPAWLAVVFCAFLLMIVVGPFLIVTATVEARFADEQHIRLRRVHPDFVAAYAQVASPV
jgi:hypothetical protein